MKIKKKASVLMIAASTAAVVGVAAVSFAAWTAGTTELTASASTGTASVFGFTETPETLQLGTIVPYDQEGTYEGDTVLSVALPEYSVDNANYKVTVTSETSLTLYVLVGEQQAAVPAGWTAENTGDWKAVSSAEFNLTADLGDAKAVNVSDTYISLLLVSDANTDMATGFTLSVTLSK